MSKEKIDWIQQKWRPMMAMLYMTICAFDFILFPIGWTATQAIFHGGLTTQWQPLTLQGGGLIHVSFGAILGVSAWGRTQEKLAGVSTNQFEMGTTYIPPGQGNVQVSNNPMNNSMNNPMNNPMNNSMNNPMNNSTQRTPVMISSSGKSMPPPQIDQPL